MKDKCVTIQMKALNEYFLMVLFTFLLDRVHVFCKFEQRSMAVKGLKKHVEHGKKTAMSTKSQQTELP